MTHIPKAVITTPRDTKDYVRGLSSQITPVVNVVNGDWSQFLPTFDGQRYGPFDTNNCTQFSFIEVFETKCNQLKAAGKWSAEALAWFQANGYFDANGSFAFSERFSGILSGTSIKGGNPWSAWQAAAKYGVLPRADLSYSGSQAVQFASQEAMCADYYNPSAITPKMRQKALQSLQWFVIQYEWIGGEFDKIIPLAQMKTAILQSPLQICVPVCNDESWNSGNVAACNLQEADHGVLLYAIDIDGSFLIRDQYQPENKILRAGYFIPQVILGEILPRPATVIIPPQQEDEAPTSAQLSGWEQLIEWAAEKIRSLFPSAPPHEWQWGNIIEPA